MTITRKDIELLAPAGSRAALDAAVDAGADAVYLGGKLFNMRLHRSDMNFTDEELKDAVDFAHSRGVKVYVTLNNLMTDDELKGLRYFLAYLCEIKPDAILVQDLGTASLAKDMGVDIPLHASVMMNVHSEPAVRFLKERGFTRIVASREMTLSELSLLSHRTGIEIEYFIHGDMCIAESGQCIHSGVLFGQSSNRGRCLKPCRWPYQLAADDGEIIDPRRLYRLAIKDMCMYRHLPELIQSGVCSFKIEGRMRPPSFISRIVSIYRRAIDSYLADPAGYSVDEDDFRELYENRVRDFSTCFAFGRPDGSAIGLSGSREPMFFSRAKAEPGLAARKDTVPLAAPMRVVGRLSVRVADIDCAKAALANGADAIYVGGDVYRPGKPWRMDDIRAAAALAHETGVLAFVMTPRTTMRRECAEVAALLENIEKTEADGVIVGNIGTLMLARELTTLPVQADYTMNIMNRAAASLLREAGVAMAAVSPELTLSGLTSLLEDPTVSIEVLIHGAVEAMISDHDIPPLRDVASIDDPPGVPRFSLIDEAGERHPIRTDQYERSHILFAKDLCLYDYLPQMAGVASQRIEAQDYDAKWTGTLTRFYRRTLDAIRAGTLPPPISKIADDGPRALGIGAYRNR